MLNHDPSAPCSKHLSGGQLTRGHDKVQGTVTHLCRRCRHSRQATGHNSHGLQVTHCQVTVCTVTLCQSVHVAHLTNDCLTVSRSFTPLARCIEVLGATRATLDIQNIAALLLACNWHGILPVGLPLVLLRLPLALPQHRLAPAGLPLALLPWALLRYSCSMTLLSVTVPIKDRSSQPHSLFVLSCHPRPCRPRVTARQRLPPVGGTAACVSGT